MILIKQYGLFGIMVMLTTICSAQISFQEVGASLGVVHHIKDGTIGAGVAVYDFNQDGLDDLTFASEQRQPLAFYINTGEGFELITPLVNNTENAKQINWVDFDNDGDPDLYVVANGGINRLYENLGDLQLQDITASSGLAMDFHYGYGAVWGDYNRDGWLDLYYASKGLIGMPDLLPSYSRLFENQADGTFKEMTWQTDCADADKFPFCSAFIDYNNDQWPDIYTAHDKLQRNTLLKNVRGWKFFDFSEETNTNQRMNAMCVAPGDVNNDGWTDIYVTNTPIGSKLLLNQALDQPFQEVAKTMNCSFEGANGWGANFFDADNDGDLDLYVCGWSRLDSLKGLHFYENTAQDRFEIVRKGFEQDTTNSFTNAVGDFDNDGLLDMVVQNNQPHPFYLWHNQSTTQNHWIKLQLEGVMSNRDGIGTRIECYAGRLYQSHYTQCGTGFLAQNSGQIQLGLGASELVDSMIVTWSSGHIDRFYQISTKQLLHIREGESTDGNIHIAPDVTIKNKPLSTSLAAVKQEELEVLVFPNPSDADFQLLSSDIIQRIEVFDALGRKVLVQSVLQTEANVQLARGTYWLKIYAPDGRFVFKRLVKF
ncbi:MAG: FG-GAP-like repeat-containing protein [Bacteroidota bacterium]